MRKRYKPWRPLEPFLFPPSPRDWLHEKHLAYFVLELVEQFDLSPIDEVLQDRDTRGEQPFSPKMMVAVLLYGYCTGVYSSRRIERGTWEDVAFRVLAGDCHPHFTTIARFRRIHLEALRGLFIQTVHMCRDVGLLRSERVALDGTKVQANASKRKAMSYGRMKKKLGELEREVEGWLAEAEAIDQAEDEVYGVGKSESDHVIEAVRDPRTRRDWIKRQLAALEKETRLGRAEELSQQAQRNEAAAKKAPVEHERKRRRTTAKKRREQSLSLFGDDDPPPADELPRNVPPHDSNGVPRDRAQRNFTDPDSRIMRRDGAFMQGYNCQTVVDEDSQVIVATGVGNLAPDQLYLPPMLDWTLAALGQAPRSFVTDAGYWSEANAERLEAAGTEPFIATQREHHGLGMPATRSGPPPPGLSARQRMDWRLQTPEGHERRIKRRTSNEPVFGQIKEGRGFRRFSLRGLSKVRGEWDLVALAHNIVKLHRAAAAA